MRSARFITEPDSGTGLVARGSVRMLPCVGLLLAVAASGCVMPCIGGACNSTEPLYVSPMARFGAVEKKLPECEPGKGAKPWPYFTMGKYWPKLDEWKTSRTAASAARKVLWKQMWQTKSWINAHYREGFTQAYIDVANGGNGEVPPVPPPRYWNAHFRSAKGQWRAERWFDGYRAGAAMALVEMQPLRRITASDDWSIEKPKPPFVSSPLGVGNIGAAPGCPPIQHTAGYGIPGQSFGPPAMAPGTWPGQPMAPGYGASPWGQSIPGTPSSIPGPQHAYPPAGGPAQNSLPPNAGFGAPPIQPQARPMAPPQPPARAPQPLPASPGPAAGALPAPASGPGAVPSGPTGDVVPAPGSAAHNEPPRPIPQNLIPGFSPFANRPANIPKDDPVWRTRPPGPMDQ